MDIQWQDIQCGDYVSFKVGKNNVEVTAQVSVVMESTTSKNTLLFDCGGVLICCVPSETPITFLGVAWPTDQHVIYDKQHGYGVVSKDDKNTIVFADGTMLSRPTNNLYPGRFEAVC